jgi:hypothetical protein
MVLRARRHFEGLMLSRTKREALRRSFRPPHVRVLFVGEAPPRADGFFYEPGSSRHRVVERVFLEAFGPRFQPESFLRWFADAGCYLEDVCQSPVDGLSKEARESLCRAGEKRLAETILELRPLVIVVLMRRIAGYVRGALDRAGVQAEIIEVPYPGRWPAHREVFEGTMVPSLRRWQRTGILVLPDGGAPSARQRHRAVRSHAHA